MLLSFHSIAYKNHKSSNGEREIEMEKNRMKDEKKKFSKKMKNYD
jgi:hypothetical protein